MTVKVVDAAALAAVLFGEPEGAVMAPRLEGATLAAPRLLAYELGNTCWKKCRRYPDLAPALRAAYGALGTLELQWHDIDRDAVLELAAAQGLTFYDASYRWLAERLGAELVSLDARLQPGPAASR